MKVIGYVRVSTEEQANQGFSLTAQADKLKAYAALYDLQLIGIIEDAGQSAKTINRPGLQQALQMIREGQTGGILIAKLDRLTRSIIDLNTLIKDYFGDGAKYPASLLSVADQVDTRTAGGRLVLNILMSVAQWEREAIGERTKTTLKSKKEHLKVYNRTPYGFDRDGEDLTVNAKEQKLIKRIKRMRTSGLSFGKIATALNDDNTPTKTGGRWHASTISYILKNNLHAEVA